MRASSSTEPGAGKGCGNDTRRDRQRQPDCRQRGCDQLADFVGFQIRQYNQMMRDTAIRRHAERIQSVSKAMFEVPDLADIWLRGGEDFGKLSAEERVRFINLYVYVMRGWERCFFVLRRRPDFGRTRTRCDPRPPRLCMNTSRNGFISSPRMPPSRKSPRTACGITPRFRKRRRLDSSRPSWRFYPARKMRISSGARSRFRPRYGWAGEQLIMNLVCAPGGKAFWKERSYLFGDEFRQHIEKELMNRKPHPDAKPMGAFSIDPRTDEKRAP
jgi:hypothetical protein